MSSAAGAGGGPPPNKAPTTIGILHISLRSVLSSIEQLADAYVRWTSLAPGLVHGPPSRIAYLQQLQQQRSSSDDQVAPGVPVIGDVWRNSQLTYASKTHTEGIKGLRFLKTSIKRELEYLEKYATDEYTTLHPGTSVEQLFSEDKLEKDLFSDTSLPLPKGLASMNAPPSSNAPGLCAQWEQLLLSCLTSDNAATLTQAIAPMQLTQEAVLSQSSAVGRRGRRSKKKAAAALPDEQIKIDGVYRISRGSVFGQDGSLGGKQEKWMKLVTTKERSLLGEFRMAESYINSDEESDAESDGGAGSRGQDDENDEARGDEALRNCSLFKTICDLSKAAQAAASAENSKLPEIELVLTRLPIPTDSAPAPQLEAGQVYAMSEQDRFSHRMQRLVEIAAARNIHVVSGEQRVRELAQMQKAKGGAASVLPSALAYGHSALPGNFTLHDIQLPGVPPPPTRTSPKLPEPTHTINLDLSALVALVSDVTHMQIPPSLLEASASATDTQQAPEEENIEERYLSAFKKITPWKEGALASTGEASGRSTPVQHQSDSSPIRSAGPQSGLTQGRALASQLQREARALATHSSSGDDRWGWAFLPGLLRTVLGSDCLAQGKDYPPVRFCTTAEAKQKFEDILKFVSGDAERMRAAALFESDGGQAYWQGSRYEDDTQLRRLVHLPVEIVEEPDLFGQEPTDKLDFARVAVCVLRAALKASNFSPKVMPFSKPVAPATDVPLQLSGTASKQTPHTIHSLLVGFLSGRTTLTTNIASIRWLMKEISIAVSGNGADLLQFTESPQPLLWVTYPRSLAENMKMDADDAAVQLPGRRTAGSDTTPEIEVSTTEREGSGYEESKGKSSLLTSGEAVVALELGGQTALPRHRRFRRVLQFLQGPRRPARMTIRHYPWWPFAGLEAWWLRSTRQIRWKDPADHFGSPLPVQVPDEEEEYDMQGHEPRWWAQAVKRDVKLNALHWVLLCLTLIGWILGFAYISKHLWYESAVNAASAQDTTALQFFQCTSTFWLRNEQCGLNGQSCTPFASNITTAFRCPSNCASTDLGAARAIGNELVNWVPLVVGGGDQDVTYRGDSWICPAAIHAGLFSNGRGGCGIVRLIGSYSGFSGVDRHGLQSFDFNSTHPIAYRFEALSDVKGCSDDRWKGYVLDPILSAFVAIVLQPKPIVLYWTLICAGFWHINMFSEPRDFPPPVGDPFKDFLPTLFVAYALWRVAIRFVWPAFKRLPIERSIWQLGLFWIGVQLNIVFANVPLNRLISSDITTQPGSLTALIIIVIVVVIIALNQVRVIRKTGYLPKYLALYITGGIIVAILTAVPGEVIHVHHWIIAVALLPGCAWPTRLSLIYASFLIGMYLNGAGRWGMDGLLEDVATVRGDATIGSDLPTFATTQTNWTGVTPTSNGTVTWNPIPDDLKNSWDSFALLVDDVLRYQGPDTTFILNDLIQDYISDADTGISNNLTTSATDDLRSQLASEAHYLRLAYVSNGQYGDYTRAAIAYYNGTWIDPPPGAT